MKEKTIILTFGKQKKEHDTMNTVLICLGLFILLFVISMIVTFWVKGSVPDTLIQYTLGAGGIEALLLAGIKIAKIFKGEKPEEIDEERY